MLTLAAEGVGLGALNPGRFDGPVGVTERVAHVSIEIGRLEDNVCKLNDLTLKLFDVLSPVLRTPKEGMSSPVVNNFSVGPTDATAIRSSSSPLADELASRNFRLEEIVNRVRCLIDCVDC